MRKRFERARTVASWSATAGAILYFLIAVGFVDVGAEPMELFGAGLGMGFALLLASFIVVDYAHPLLLAIVALMDVAGIAGYVVTAGTRNPPIEPWGILLQALQLAMLVAVAFMIAIRLRPRTDLGPTKDVLRAKPSGD